MTKGYDTADWKVEFFNRSGGAVSCGTHQAQFTVSSLGFVQLAWPPNEPAADVHGLRRAAQEAAEQAVRRSAWQHSQ